MKLLLTFSLIIGVLSLSGQTRRIAHRTHSGSDYETYDGIDGNYGFPITTHTVVVAQQKCVRLENGNDTVIWDRDTVTEPNDVPSLYTDHLNLIPYRIGDISEMGKSYTRLSQHK